MEDMKTVVVREFPWESLGDRRVQALKVLEEASELCEAVKSGFVKNEIMHEVGNLLQAVANLCKVEYIGMQECYDVSYESDVERGRFDA